MCPLFGVQITGGEGGIRTPETLAGLLAFQASALGHYATSPHVTESLQKECNTRNKNSK